VRAKPRDSTADARVWTRVRATAMPIHRLVLAPIGLPLA
jgi:hypothetical protein